MRTLKTSEAAAVLGVSPHTLRSWERRFGFPSPRRTAGRQRLYTYNDIASLRDGLANGLSISSAISAARVEHVADPEQLLCALNEFRADRADDAMERALTIRSLENALELVLLPALKLLHERHGGRSAVWGFAAGWGQSWLLRAQRLAMLEPRRGAVLVGEAAVPPLAPAILSLRALELCCMRSGMAVVSLPVGAPEDVSVAVSALEPDAVVIAGGCASDADVARWAYRVRLCAGSVPFLIYQRDAVKPSARVLPPSPTDARARLEQVLFRHEQRVLEST
jgi:DNA-binding transcriptional MerR regulator